MKYIMFAVDSPDKEFRHFMPVIFPEVINHDDMARGVKYALRLGRSRRTISAMSAGFIEAVTGKVDMSRTSETLRLGPDPLDETRINTWRYTYGQF